MKHLQKGNSCFIGIVLLLLLYLSTFIMSGAGNTAATFLLLEPGGRANAMGGVYTAIGKDAFTVMYNPALPSLSEKIDIALMQNIYVQSLNQTCVSYTQKLEGIGTVGVGINMLFSDAIAVTTIDDPDGTGGSTFKSSDKAFMLSYSREVIKNLNAGLNLKMIMQSLDDASGSAYGADIGVVYIMNQLKLGLSLMNLGTSITMVSEPYGLPMLVKFGVGYSLLDNNLTIGTDVDFNLPDSQLTVKAGVEYILMDMLAIRAGYRTSDVSGLSGITTGLGFSINSIKIDYALNMMGDLGMSHKISAGYMIK